MMNRILSLVGWIGTAMVFVAVAIRFGYPVKEQWAYYLAWGGLVCVLVYTLGQWREIAKVFSRRQTRYGTLLAVSILVVLGILIAINYIGKIQNRRWDLTASKQFSLSDQSRNVLAKLDSPLQVQVFAQEPDFGRYQDRLKEYEYGSKKVTTEYIDPDKKPTIAKQSAIQQYGTIVFNYKGRTERVTADNEQDITNGIIKVVSGQQRKVYFTSGHGEKDTTSADRDGYNAIAAALGHENYALEKLVIAQQGAVPDDASVVVVAGPRTDYFPAEIDALKKYLDKSGKLLLALDPPDKADSPPLTNLIALAHDWGVQVGNNVVVDVSGMGRLIGTDASVPVAANYLSYPIAARFTFITAYPLAREASPVSGGVNGRGAAVREAASRSWKETDIKELLASGKVSPTRRRATRKRAGHPRIGRVGDRHSGSAAQARRRRAEAGDARRRHGRLDFAANAGLGIRATATCS
jgi:ABC-type uncharacterized transport system involved in gliding motility auxiliary subunit